MGIRCSLVKKSRRRLEVAGLELIHSDDFSTSEAEKAKTLTDEKI